MASVLICDERRGIRQNLARALSALPGLDTVNTTASGDELLCRYPYERPDLVIIGTCRADDAGIMTVRRLSAAHADAAILVFGAGDDQVALTAAMACGARGFLSWDALRPEDSGPQLRAALAQTLRPAEPVAVIPAPRTHSDLRPGAPSEARPDRRVDPRPGAPLFTDRELQVLQGMSEGKSNTQIGRDLYLSGDTVKTHARRLFRKIGVQHRAQAVAYGIRNGLVR